MNRPIKNYSIYYTNRKGAGCFLRGNKKTAVDILKGARNATEARVERMGVPIGHRWKQDGKWNWFISGGGYA